MIKSDLEKAFEETNFIIDISKNQSILLRINQPCVELEELFPTLNSWAFVTAWNPLPTILSLNENSERNFKLEHDIKDLELNYFHGKGVAADGNWSEDSFFILGCSKTIAIELGKKYGQLAIVYGERGGVNQLLFLNN